MMRNRREDIEYHNRKFKVNLNLNADDGEFSIRLDPPNEFAFSDRYSQCLIKINKARAVNGGDLIAFGVDAVWWNVNLGAVTSIPSGVILQSNLVSNNCLTVSDAQVRRGVSCLLTGTSCIPNVFNGLAMNGASEVIRGGAAGTDTNIHKVNEWLFEDNRSIEDAGILCGNPFGRDISFNFRVADGTVANDRVFLTSASNQLVAGATGSSIGVELEILMLPNPTPDDR